jgi:hypothetical protein
MRIPIHLAFWACILAIFAPGQFLGFQKRKNLLTHAQDTTVRIVFRAFWISLILVFLSGMIGLAAGIALKSLLGTASGHLLQAVQILGTLLLLWGTLFLRGWDIQSWKGETLIERVNQWIFRFLYCAGTAILVGSLTWGWPK